MDFSAYPEPLQPGWGYVFQGGAITGQRSNGERYLDAEIFNLPSPLMIVNVNGGEAEEQLVGRNVQMVLSRWFGDAPEEAVPDETLIGLVEAICAVLKVGINVYIHCAAGWSRSSYIHCAVRMRARGITRDEALAEIRAHRPPANPNAGFMDHLARMEPWLTGTPVG